MLGQKKLCEINGKKYMSPGGAKDLWGISTQKITAACLAGRVEGACTDSSGKWIIPIDSRKPLEAEVIRRIMISLLALKNKHDGLAGIQMDQIDAVFDYLWKIECIESFDTESESFPYDVTLTDKGMKIATEGPVSGVNWLDLSGTIINCISIAITLWGMH